MIKLKFNWWNHQPVTDELLKKLSKLTGDYTIYVMDGKPNRSLPQLRFYWGVILRQVEDQTGYEREELHNFMKVKYGKRTITFIGADSFEEISGFRGKNGFSRAESSEFIDKVIRWWTEKGVVFTLEGDMTTEQYLSAYNDLEMETIDF